MIYKNSHILPRFMSRYEHISRYRTDRNIWKTNICIIIVVSGGCIPQVKATHVYQVLNASYYCYTVETSAWYYRETLKPFGIDLCPPPNYQHLTS